MARKRALQALAAAASLYLAFLLLYEVPFLFAPSGGDVSGAGISGGGDPVPRRLAAVLHSDGDSGSAPPRPAKRAYKPSPLVSSMEFRLPDDGNPSKLHSMALDAFGVGKMLLDELRATPPLAQSSSSSPAPALMVAEAAASACPDSIAISGEEFESMKRMIELPCGLALGSHITVAATPRFAHEDADPKIVELQDGERSALVSQFMLELQGIRAVDGEAPPKILHFNPRLKGDFTGKPAIEMNTCYRMQWGPPLRCEGSRSRADEETVDGNAKCEDWIRDGESGVLQRPDASWLKRFIGTASDGAAKRPFPFEEGKLFVLTLSAGLEGYHVSVDGRHVASFPYRTGYGLEDATGLSLNGDIDIRSIFAAGLPSSHPNSALPRVLEMSPQWKASPLRDSDEPVELFIGILSATSHFAERMAVRRSWMTSVRRSPSFAARFFVALSGRKEVNEQLMKEAGYFGDIVIVPFLDHYDLVVFKSIAICRYGVQVVQAKYIMKCDDDTFVRIDTVMQQLRRAPSGQSLYIGNMNYFHKPLRSGKWAVTPEEWPEEYYPPYANGAGYVISLDIAQFIVSELENNTLRLFKMEDVSVGLWVMKYYSLHRPVEYVHDQRFCQFGCIDEYYTAHYQSPRQMICLWNKLQSGHAQCCNAR